VGPVRREYTLSELAAAVGMTERNVRAYRSRGLIRPPRLHGRVGYYGYDHLTQLRLVQALTGRGLSLAVVGQILDRGLAQHELARLIGEDLPEGPAAPIAPDVVEEVTLDDPELLDAIVDEGVGCRTADGFAADPALLALANQLVAYGVPMVEVSRIILTGARAAGSATTGVRRGLQAPRSAPVREPTEGADPGEPTAPKPDAVIIAVLLELATTAFRLALRSQLSRPAP
jgi:DNA-binding transcriptional MerR regulator